MSNTLSKLENNEAILMMYLAGELPLEDRLEVDQMLQRDSALRGQLTSLRRELEHVADAFAIEVAQNPLAGEEAVQQRLRPVMRQWAADRLTRPRSTSAAVQRRPAPWFLYPLIGTAAALVLVALILSQLDPSDRSAHTPAVVYAPDWQERETPYTTTNSELSRQTDVLVETMDDADPLNNVATDRLAKVSTELAAIKKLADSMEAGNDMSFLQ